MDKIEILENGDLKITRPLELRHVKGRKRILFADERQKLVSEGEDALALNLARGIRWQELIDTGHYSNGTDLGKAVGRDYSYITRYLRLAQLSPKIVHAILRGDMIAKVRVGDFRFAVPSRWDEQERIFLGNNG